MSDQMEVDLPGRYTFHHGVADIIRDGNLPGVKILHQVVQIPYLATDVRSAAVVLVNGGQAEFTVDRGKIAQLRFEGIQLGYNGPL